MDDPLNPLNPSSRVKEEVMDDILDLQEGEEFNQEFNANDLDEKEVLGETDHQEEQLSGVKEEV
jgi:hypothetical protein